MRAIILEIKGKNVIALDKEGRFIKTPFKADYNVGSEVEIVANKFHRINIIKYASVAAAFIFSIGIGYGAYTYSVPYSYINIDINPSVEIIANRYDRILKTVAINNDGNELLQNENLKRKSVEEGIQDLINKAVEKGFVKEDSKNSVMLTVSSINAEKAKELEKEIQNSAQKDNNKVSKEMVIVEKISLERHEAAKEIGISPGKLLLIERLQEAKGDNKVTVEEYKDTPVKDIMKEIVEHKKEEKKDKGDVDKKDNKDNIENKKGNLKDNTLIKKREDNDKVEVKSTNEVIGNKNSNIDKGPDKSALSKDVKEKDKNFKNEDVKEKNNKKN